MANGWLSTRGGDGLISQGAVAAQPLPTPQPQPQPLPMLQPWALGSPGCGGKSGGRGGRGRGGARIRGSGVGGSGVGACVRMQGSNEEPLDAAAGDAGRGKTDCISSAPAPAPLLLPLPPLLLRSSPANATTTDPPGESLGSDGMDSPRSAARLRATVRRAFEHMEMSGQALASRACVLSEVVRPCGLHPEFTRIAAC